MYSITTAEQPAIDDAERFVRALFEGYEDEGLACIIDVLLKPNPKRPGKFLWTSKNENYYPMPGRMDDLLGDLLGLIKSHPERDVYICTQLLKDRSRKKESSKKLRVAWAEFDAGEDLPEGMPPPSIIVESSPGHFHAYWLLDEECDPFAVEALNRGIAYRFEADMGGWDLSQVLRVPGTLNHKYPDSPEVRLLKLAPKLVYTYEELAEQAPPIKEETHPLEDLDNGETREDEARALLGLIAGKVRPNILETIEEGWESYTPREGGDYSRSAADAAVVSALLGAGLTPTQIRTIYQHYPVGTEGKYSERGDKYLKLTIKEMRAWRRDKLGKVPAPTDELSPNGSSENHRHHNHDSYRGDDCDD